MTGLASDDAGATLGGSISGVEMITDKRLAALIEYSSEQMPIDAEVGEALRELQRIRSGLRSQVLTEEERHALAQFQELAKAFNRETGKGDYYLPGGWAGEQLAKIITRGEKLATS
jgi:hypothetical protein